MNGSALRIDTGTLQIKFRKGYAAQLQQEAKQAGIKEDLAKMTMTFRAQRAAAATAVKPLADAVSKCIKQGELVSPASQEMIAAQTHSVFALCAFYEDCTSEKDQLPCVRITVSGTRTVVMVRTGEVIAFMQDNGLLPDKFKMKAVWGFVKHMSKSVVTEFAKEHSVFHCTVGKEEALVIPPGMCVL